jgi:hypothetical protein
VDCHSYLGLAAPKTRSPLRLFGEADASEASKELFAAETGSANPFTDFRRTIDSLRGGGPTHEGDHGQPRSIS